MKDQTKPKDGSIYLSQGGGSGPSNAIYIHIREPDQWKGVGSSTTWKRKRGTSIQGEFHFTPDFTVGRVFGKGEGPSLIRKYFPAFAGREVYFFDIFEGYVLQGVV